MRGNPTAEEIAAVTVALRVVASRVAAESGPKHSGWADPARRLRAQLRPGPDAWVRSALPR